MENLIHKNIRKIIMKKKSLSLGRAIHNEESIRLTNLSDDSLSIIHNLSQIENNQAPTAKNPSPALKLTNAILRCIVSCIMLIVFSFVIYLGPLFVMILIFLIQVCCFNEVINIGFLVYKSNNLPWLRAISWYFLLTLNFYLCGQILIDKFGIFLVKENNEILRFVVNYHRFISFTLYIIGFIAFVASLKKLYYFKQFTLFGFTHLPLLLIVAQSNLMIINLFQGFIWFVMPVSLIICNDITSYVFGMFFGKNILIAISPKKTWEGFIGGAITTMIISFLISYIFCSFRMFLCPIEYDDLINFLKASDEDCQVSSMFVLNEYKLPRSFSFISSKLNFSMFPFQMHAFYISIFASLISPFGGFFASGFKRAFQLKDFSNAIPGHGGFMDRFDCQFLIATFVNVYTYTFISSPPNTSQKLLSQFSQMNFNDQVDFLKSVNEYMASHHVYNNSNAT